MRLRAEEHFAEAGKLVLSKGVSLSDADYVLFEVGKMEGDFEENLDKFLSENEKFVSSGRIDKSDRRCSGKTERYDYCK